MRSGKSFILGLFLKYLFNGGREDWIDLEIKNTFEYSNSDERVTTGIWIYSEPIIKKNRKGDDIAIFMMDTQGWHDDKTTKRDNEMIFGLSAFLSAVMIFNFEKRIGEDDLNYPQNFTNTAQALGEMGDQPFQRLIFLIRDWNSIDQRTGFPYGYYDTKYPKDYKDFIRHKWDPKGKSDEAQKIREMLSILYERICAYLMPDPGRVVRVNEFDSRLMDEEFKMHLISLCSILFDKSNIELNFHKGKYLRGWEMFKLIKNKWADDFKIESTRPISGADDVVPYQMAYETAKDYFDKIMSKMINSCNEIKELEGLLIFQE